MYCKLFPAKDTLTFILCDGALQIATLRAIFTQIEMDVLRTFESMSKFFFRWLERSLRTLISGYIPLESLLLLG